MPRAAYITDDIAAVLSDVTVEGRLVRLPDRQLDRKLYTAVNKVLETLGGKWDRKQKGHLFAADVGDRIQIALGNGVAERDPEHMIPEELERERIKRLQFFQTPEVLAQQLAFIVVNRGDIVCEPNAGHGRLVQAALDEGAAMVIAVELCPENCEHLRKRFADAPVEVHCGDFLTLAAEWLAKPTFQGFDAVLMNPPFTQRQDIQHVTMAARLLKPGGALHAIMSNHFVHAENAEAAAFRRRLEVRGADIAKLPSGSFKAEGTDVEAVTVLIERPRDVEDEAA